jgi:hypothetical protein
VKLSKSATVEDAEGYACFQSCLPVQCSDCSIAVCSGHAEGRDLCSETFCLSCLSFHRSEVGKPASSQISRSPKSHPRKDRFSFKLRSHLRDSHLCPTATSP